ncbi:unnamed protein product [Closterium sp. Yama58-4]|nr:unnamed protein product [Closterium sp. Yama58-4]
MLRRQSTRGKGKEKVSDNEPPEDPPYVAWMKEQQKQGKPSPSIKRLAKPIRDFAGASTSRGPRHDDTETRGDTDVSDDELEEIMSESESDADSDKLAKDWTEEEVKNVFSVMAANKSPRKDGLPNELFQAHWDLLGKGFMALAKVFATSAVLSTEVKEAVMILLHKKGDKDQLNNYRPITLLNFTYKVLARVVADRMTKVLSKVISPEQYGFLLGRRLTDALGLVADIIDTARNNNEDWFLLLFDFRKAFDSVSRGYLFRTLRSMVFPERLVSWVEGLHKGTQARLLVNGWIGVEVVSGVRQGCPLASYLFLCAVEPLAQLVIKRKLGISKAGERLAYIGHADDITLILEGKGQLIRAEQVLEKFEWTSGKSGKNSCLTLGEQPRSDDRPDAQF